MNFKINKKIFIFLVSILFINILFAASIEETFFRQAVRYYIEGKSDLAQKALNEILIRDPDNKSALTLLNKIKGNEQNISDAEAVSIKGQPQEQTNNINTEYNVVDDSINTDNSEKKKKEEIEKTEETEETSYSQYIKEFKKTNTKKKPSAKIEVVNNIKIAAERNKVKIFISGTGILNFISSKIYSPPMIIIDIPSSIDDLPKKIDLKLGNILRIRHSQYRTLPIETTRVVIDLKKWSRHYNIYRQGKYIIAEIDTVIDKLPSHPRIITKKNEKEPIPEATITAQEKIIKLKIDDNNIKTATIDKDEYVDFQIKVIDEENNPIPDKKVKFAVIASEALIDADLSQEGNQSFNTSDSQGIIIVRVYPLKNANTITIAAYLEGEKQSSVMFNVKLNPAKPAKILINTGNEQEGLFGSLLDQPLTVIVTDTYGNPVPGVKVFFKISEGKGKIDCDKKLSGVQFYSLTDNIGEAKCEAAWLGIEDKENKIKAFFSDDTGKEKSVIFTEYGRPRLITIDFKDANLSDVLRTLAELASWNLAIGQSVQKLMQEDESYNLITIHLKDVTTLEALDTILDIKGFTRVQQGNIFKIVLKSEAVGMGVPVNVGNKKENVPEGTKTVTQIIPLKNIAAKPLSDQLAALLSVNGKILADERSNSIIITDGADNVTKIVQIINYLDQIGTEKEFAVEIFFLKYADATEIATELNSLYSDAAKAVKESGSNSKSSKSKVSTPNSASLSEPAIFVANQKQNAVIVATTKLNLSVIKGLIGKLDVSVEEKPLVMGVKFTEAGFIQDALNKIFPASKIVAEEASNVLIVWPKNTEEKDAILEIIKEIDSKESTLKEKVFEIYVLKYADPILVATQLQSMLQQFGVITLPALNFFDFSSKSKTDVKTLTTFFREITKFSKVSARAQSTQILPLPQQNALLIVAPKNLWNDPIKRLLDSLDISLLNVMKEKNLDVLIYQPKFVDGTLLSKTITSKSIAQVIFSEAKRIALLIDKNKKQSILNLISSLDKGGLEDLIEQGYEIFIYKTKFVKPADLAKTLQTEQLGKVLFSDENRIAILVKKEFIDTLDSLLNQLDQALPDNYSIVVHKAKYIDPNVLSQRVEQEKLAKILYVDNFRLVLMTKKSEEAKLKALLYKTDQRGFTTEVYRLKHTKAKEIIDVLTNMSANWDMKVNFSADERTNAIIIIASPENIPDVINIIKQIDIWPAQVVLEAIILEYTLSKDDQMSLRTMQRPSMFFKMYEYTGDDATSVNNFTNWNLVNEDDNPSAINAEHTSSSQYPSNINKSGAKFYPSALNSPFAVILNKKNFLAVFEALARTTKIEVLSRPKLIALNNQKATITVGQTITFEETVVNQGVSQTNIKERDVALTLDILPIITDNRHVRMDVTINIEQLVPQAQNSSASYQTAKRKATTSVILQDEQFVAMAGIIKENTNEVNEKVPFLGDLPVIGNLFKQQTKEKDKTELMIFITPHVIASPDEATLVTKKISDFEKITPFPINVNTDSAERISDLTVLKEFENSYNLKNFALEVGAALVEERKANGPYRSIREFQRTLQGIIKQSIYTRMPKLKEQQVDDITSIVVNSIVSNIEVKVNLNTALSEELSNIKNIDIDMAYELIRYRRMKGTINSVSEAESIFLKYGLDKNYFNTYLKPILIISPIHGTLYPPSVINTNKEEVSKNNETPSQTPSQTIYHQAPIIKKEIEQEKKIIEQKSPEQEESPVQLEEQPVPVKESSSKEPVKESAKKPQQPIVKKSEEPTNADKININTVTLEELKKAGLSDLSANLIIIKRKSVKKFNNIDEIYSIPGVNRADIDKIKDKIIFSNEPANDKTISDKREENIVPENKETDNSANEPETIPQEKFNSNKNNLKEFKINLNTATIEELKKIPKINDELAKKIFNYRFTYGDFLSIDELRNIDGITDNIIKEITPYIIIK